MSPPGVRGGPLAEVPDVPDVVVGVPVMRLLRDRAVVRAAEHVEHHRRRDALDRLRLVGDGHPLSEVLAVFAAAVVQHHPRSEEHTSELQSPYDLVCCLLLETKKNM